MTRIHKHEKTLEEKEQEIKAGDAEEEVYSEAAREELVEDEDEITDADEGFMKGYEEGAKMAKCPICGKVITADFVEKEINDEVYRFCSEEHAEKYAKSHSDRKEEIDVGEDEEEDDDLEDIERDKRRLKKAR
ncbi:hypothetical protein FJZ53_02240 [Candidatus Woesearchaeota archaeon]|nr:hypothetical protein [Candidatus Woesearchaeota archaeon]